MNVTDTGVGSDATAARLAAIDARLERLERMLAPVAELTAAIPGGTATVTDILDEWALQDGRVDERLRNLHKVLLQLSEPKTLGMLSEMIVQAQQLPQMVATIVDIGDDIAAESARNGVRVEAVVQSARRAIKGLSRLATAPEVTALFESGMLDPATLKTLGRVAAAVGEAQKSARPIGLLGAWRASRDAGVQRALGFMMAVAAEFGRAISDDDQPKRLEDGNV